jgi:hypothetical protein
VCAVCRLLRNPISFALPSPTFLLGACSRFAPALIPPFLTCPLLHASFFVRTGIFPNLPPPRLPHLLRRLIEKSL